MLPVSTKDVIDHSPLLDRIADLRRLQAQADSEADRAALAPVIAQLQADADAAPQPVYRLAVASYLQRAAFRRDVRAAGAAYPGDADLYAALRADLRDCAPGNLDDLLATVDEVEAAGRGEVDPDAVSRLGDIARLARALGHRYAALEGDREYWLSVAPIVACRHFLLGWQNVPGADGQPAPFERVGGRTTDATLQQLDEPDLRAVGYAIIALMRPTKDQEKNSAWPSPSRGGLKPSQTATRLLTEALGTSLEPSTAETPAAG